MRKLNRGRCSPSEFTCEEHLRKFSIRTITRYYAQIIVDYIDLELVQGNSFFSAYSPLQSAFFWNRSNIWMEVSRG